MSSLSLAVGLALAIAIDQRVKGEAIWRTIFLYPLAVSFVVTGTVWSWLYSPDAGIEFFVRSLGWHDFTFRLTTNRDTAIYAIIATGIWQSSGFAMALLLAGLRSVDPDIVKAAQIDGAGPARIYRKVIIPSIAPIFVAVIVVLLQFAIKTFDLVVALTRGGPGISTTFPANYVYDLMFQRGEIAIGAAAAIMMLAALAVVLVPYALWTVWRSAPRGRPWLTRPSIWRSICRRAARAFAIPSVASAIYAFLALFALIYLLPLFVVVANSFRELPEITQNGLIALPHSFSLKAWPQAWAHYCVAGTCEGVKRNFFNSLYMTIPATILSTLLGAMNGYVLSKWRFPGSETLFICIVLGVFMPGQVALLPWAYILGALASLEFGLWPHSRSRDPGTLVHDAVLPQLLRQHPRRPHQGGPHRRRRLLADLLQDHPSPVAADPDRHRDLAIHRHLERIPVRRRLHRRTRSSRSPPRWSRSRQVSMSAHAYDVASAAVIIGAIPPLLIYLFGGKYFVRGLTQGAIK